MHGSPNTPPPPPHPYLHVGVKHLGEGVRDVIPDWISVSFDLLADGFDALAYYIFNFRHRLLVEEEHKSSELVEGETLQLHGKGVRVTTVFLQPPFQVRVHQRPLEQPRGERILNQREEAVVVFFRAWLDLGSSLQVGGTSVCIYTYSARRK